MLFNPNPAKLKLMTVTQTDCKWLTALDGVLWSEFNDRATQREEQDQIACMFRLILIYPLHKKICGCKQHYFNSVSTKIFDKGFLYYLVCKVGGKNQNEMEVQEF